MKKSLLFLAIFQLLFILCFSQGVPEGMKYQAVARNTKGGILSNETIVLEISLVSNTNGKSKVHYSEAHTVTTSAQGLFDLVIGAGTISKGVFSNVPWSTDDIWMQVGIKEKGSADFTTVSNSKLLAVPYAFHAATASQLSGGIKSSGEQTAIASANNPGSPATPWMTFGNVGTNPGIDKLGTTDVKDLVIITSNIERLRILANGDINFKNNLSIEKDLLVKGNVNLNTVYGGTVNNGPLAVKQATSLQNTLTVTGATVLNSTLLADKAAVFNQTVLLSNASLGSTSPSTGALVVNGGVGIGQNLNVGGTANFGGATSFGGKLLVSDATSSGSTTTGAAVVTGGVGIGKELNVGGATSLGNTLQVTGATKLLNTLEVGGAATLQKGLTVTGLTVFNDSVVMNNDLSTKSLTVSSSNAAYLAVLENTDGSTGDGLKIKLGKTHPMWNNGSYVSVPNIAADAFQGPINTIRGWVIDHNPVQASDLLNLFPATLVAGTVINIVNTVTAKINEKLNLPLSIGPYGIPAIEVLPRVTFIPEICVPEIGICPVCTPAFCTPALVAGPYSFPATNVIPKLTVFPSIPAIPTGGLPSLSVPNLSFTDVSNSLTNENEFISFVDKDNRQLGSIRAQSINNFSADYLNGVYFVNLMASLVGIDIVSGIAGGIAQFTNLADAYNSIGVEYSSGHGDYAEWLERSNLAEVISSGDIVGVKAGKISKNLVNAEQVMVVSYHPIILGNTPPEGKENEGNKVAFMGQVPVKITGPVKAGDYIVADAKMPGYGNAVNPSKMTLKIYPLCIGRSWQTNLNKGPKMVNTLISSGNTPILEILSKDEKKIEKIDIKLSNLEEKLNLYLLRTNSKMFKNTSLN